MIGIVLTGYQDDGTAGLQAIASAGGRTIVQDPDDALVPEMPLNALRHVDVDYRVALAEMIRAFLEKDFSNEHSSNS